MSERGAFAALVRSPQPGLADGCFLIGAHLGRPDDLELGPARLARLVERVGAAIEARGVAVDLETVAAVLVGQERFAGAVADYHQPRNSYLAEVLRRRRGIPITLSIVVVEVAARLGVDACGVGMPGHFLVGDGASPRRWLDPFHGTGWLDEAGAQERFRAVHGPSATFDPSFLAPTPPRLILARVLANLAGSFRASADPTSLLRALELRSDIPGIGRSPRARFELVEAYAAVGRVADALEVLDGLVERVDPRRREALLARRLDLESRFN